MVLNALVETRKTNASFRTQPCIISLWRRPDRVLLTRIVIEFKKVDSLLEPDLLDSFEN